MTPQSTCRLAAWALGLAAAVLAIEAFRPIARGSFLADDFSYLVTLGGAREAGDLLGLVASRFVHGIDAGDNRFWRPIPFATFALQFVASGARPGPWMVATVLLHVLNAILVGCTARAAMASPARPSDPVLAVGAAALFLFLASSVEVLGWVSGRFDALATAFTLLCVLAFLRSHAPFDRAWWVSLAAMVAAFLSKESAAVIPFAIALLAWARAIGAGEAGRAAWPSALRRAGPWLAVAGVYLLARAVIFGSAVRVYAGADPLADAFSGSMWAQVARTAPGFFAAHFAGAAGVAMGIVLAVLLVEGIALGERERGARAMPAAFAASSAIAFLLVLPHAADLPADGAGGRLLYQSAAFASVLAALAARGARHPRPALALLLALVALALATQRPVVERWRMAHAQMRAVVPAVVREAAAVPEGGYALLVVPDRLAGVFFGRAAQAGLMLPPVQPRALSGNVLVQLDIEIGDLAAKLEDGVVANLKRESLDAYGAGGRPAGRVAELPSRVACWDPGERAFRALAVPGPSDAQAWVGALRAAYLASPCARTWPRAASVTSP